MPAEKRETKRVAESAPTYRQRKWTPEPRERGAARRGSDESLAFVIERRRGVLLRLADS